MGDGEIRKSCGSCGAHSGVMARIDNMEKNVTNLWAKWNSLQMWIMGCFGAILLQLIGVIVILLRQS